MKKAVNYLRGNVRVQVQCPYPERLVNICASNNVEFWDLRRISPVSVQISMHIGGYRLLSSIATKAGFEIIEVRKAGVPFFIWRLRKRYVLLAGMLLMFLTVWTMSLFVWEIDVQGNKAVPSQEILAALRDLGIGIGTFGPVVSSEAISNDMLLRFPGLSWIAVNVSGSHAEVLVRERVPKPAILDKNVPVMVYAVKSGIITKMSALEGKDAVKPGDTVQAGDILVTGIMDSLVSGKRMVHAMAEVTARTWYDLSAQIPLETVHKTYTGEKRTRTAVIFAGKRLNLYFNGRIPFASCDKMTIENILKLPTGNVLPITIVKEKYDEYTASETQLGLLQGEELLRKQLVDRLKKQLLDGEIVKTDFEVAVDGAVMTVTLHAECLEQIAAERPFTAAELQEALTPAPSPEKKP